jgi:hypothetical protein
MKPALHHPQTGQGHNTKRELQANLFNEHK